MQIDFTLFVRFVKAALPTMVSGGSIIGLASQGGRDAGSYAASKGALITTTRGLAKELGPDIRIISVCPGMIDTDYSNLSNSPGVRNRGASVTPLKRKRSSVDVANLVAFLASDKAAFITGANLDVNGGLQYS